MLGRSRPISWLKPARKEFEGFPEGARERMLQALDIAAAGSMAAIAKPLKGFGSGVFEVALKFRTDAFRVVYAVSAAMRFGSCTRFRKSRHRASRPRKQTSTSCGSGSNSCRRT